MSEKSQWTRARSRPSLSADNLSRKERGSIFMSMVWLITGSGNGLGRDIAEAALPAGDNVVEEGETGKG